MELHALRKTAGLWWTKVYAATSGSLAKRGREAASFWVKYSKNGAKCRKIRLKNEAVVMKNFGSHGVKNISYK